MQCLIEGFLIGVYGVMVIFWCEGELFEEIMQWVYYLSGNVGSFVEVVNGVWVLWDLYCRWIVFFMMEEGVWMVWFGEQSCDVVILDVFFQVVFVVEVGEVLLIWFEWVKLVDEGFGVILGLCQCMLGIVFGFFDIDECIMGMYFGYFMVIGVWFGGGKMVIVMNVVCNVVMW